MLGITPLSYASQICFNTHSSAKQLAVSLTDYNKNTPKLLKDLNLCNQEVVNLQSQREILSTTVDKFKTQNTELQTISDDLKTKYAKAATDLIKAKEDTPSRVTWAGVGAVGTLVVILIAFIAFGK